MRPAHQNPSTKKATNLSINSELLLKARALNINLSAFFEHALTEFLAKKEQELWRIQNKEAIDQYNQLVQSSGVWSDGVRSF